MLASQNKQLPLYPPLSATSFLFLAVSKQVQDLAHHGESSTDRGHDPDEQMCERHTLSGHLHGEGKNFVHKKDPRQESVLNLVMLLSCVRPSTRPTADMRPGMAVLLSQFVMLIVYNVNHQWPEPFREEVAIGLQSCLSWLGNGTDHLLAFVRRWYNLDEVLEQSRLAIRLRYDLGYAVQRCPTLHILIQPVLRPKAQLVNDVRRIEVRRVLGNELVDVPPVALDALAHGYMKVARVLLERHVPAQMASLPPGHALGLVLAAAVGRPALPLALLGRLDHVVRPPSLPLVGVDDVVARIAAVPRLGLGPVARAAVVGRELPPALLELLVLAVLPGILVGLHADFLVGQDRSVQMQPLLHQRIDDVELTVAGHVHGVKMQVIAVQGRERYVHVHSHLLIEAACGEYE